MGYVMTWFRDVTECTLLGSLVSAAVEKLNGMRGWVGVCVVEGGGGGGGCRRRILYQLAWGVQPVQTWLPGLPLVTLKPPETLFAKTTWQCY